jgi:hypothetical protein
MATQSRMNRPRGSGLDQFYGQQNAPTSFQRLQMNTGARKAWGEEMRSSAPELLPPSERGAQESGRGYYSEERMAERDRRIKGKVQAAMLSPFVSGAQLAGTSQPQRMAQNSVMGAMNSPQLPPPITIYR